MLAVTSFQRASSSHKAVLSLDGAISQCLSTMYYLASEAAIDSEKEREKEREREANVSRGRNDSKSLLYIICRSDKHDAIGCDLGPQGRTTLLEASRHVSRGVGLGWSGPFTRARPLRAIKPGAHSPCPFACTWTRRLVESSRAAAGKAISGCPSWPLARLHLACLALATYTCCELEMRTRPPALAGEGRRLQLTNIRVCVCLCAGRAEDPEVAVAVASASHRVCPDVAPSQQRSAAALCVACSQGVSRHGLAWSRGRPPPPFLRSYAPCRDCNRTGTRHACMYTKYGT